MSTSRTIMFQLASASLTVVLILGSVVHCRPTSDFEDPLLALPSGESSLYHIKYEQITQGPAKPQYIAVQKPQYQAQQPQQTIQYILPQQYQQPQVQAQAQVVQEEPAVATKQQDSYTYQQDGQLVLMSPQEHQATHDANCKHVVVEANQQRVAQPNREYISILDLVQPGQPQESQPAQSREYPGEVIYVSQNGDNERATLSQAIQEVPQQGSEISSMASYIQPNSGMPATILTEIPVREMPPHVLGKLKRDYGVKVVATRERPGANLVINCDDASNQENSICAKQPVYESSYNLQPQHYAEYAHPALAELAPQPHGELAPQPHSELVPQPHSELAPQYEHHQVEHGLEHGPEHGPEHNPEHNHEHHHEIVHHYTEISSPQHNAAELEPQHHSELVPQHQAERAPRYSPKQRPQHYDPPTADHHHQNGPNPQEQPSAVEEHRESKRSEPEQNAPQQNGAVEEERTGESYGNDYAPRNPEHEQAAPQEPQTGRQQEELARPEEGSTSQDERRESHSEERESQDAGF